MVQMAPFQQQQQMMQMGYNPYMQMNPFGPQQLTQMPMMSPPQDNFVQSQQDIQTSVPKEVQALEEMNQVQTQDTVYVPYFAPQ